MKNLTCCRLETWLNHRSSLTLLLAFLVNQASKVQKNGRQQRLASPQVLALDSVAPSHAGHA